jgi:hypothetical protein
VTSTATLDALPFAARRVWIALAVSILVHLFAIAYFGTPSPLRDRPPTRLLVTFAPPAPAAPAEPIVAEPIPAVSATRPSPVVHRRRERTPLVVPSSNVGTTDKIDARTKGPLNFSLPPMPEAQPAPVDTNGPFDPDIAKAVAKRQETRTRVALAARRRAQREGVSSPDYERDMAAGHTIKTDSGCFDLRDDQTLDPNAPSWWRTPCKEAHVSAWQQDELTDDELYPSLRGH